MSIILGQYFSNGMDDNGGNRVLGRYAEFIWRQDDKWHDNFYSMLDEISSRRCQTDSGDERILVVDSFMKMNELLSVPDRDSTQACFSKDPAKPQP